MAPSSPTSPALPAPPNPAPEPEPASEEPESSWIGEFLTGWIRDFFADVARSALEGVLGMLADSLLSTPRFDQLPVMGQLWNSSRNIMIAAYVLVTTIAGVVVLSYQTLQTRSSVKEILPRLVIGFVAANLSLFLGGKAIEFANALSRAFLGDQTGAEEASRVFVDTLLGKVPEEGEDFSPYGDLYVVFTVLALVVMIIAVLLTYVVRIALTVLLLAAAPLVLMCHALPQTESIAFWWWRVFGAVLVVQVAQSLAFISALKIFYLPGGITIF
ncbi:hypothetical protein AB0I53_19525 [Saccharopolyspora sp. NPDC050389]|uniref:hypothetical protein n=1 Tax=Saccharopolyspora sp. NPDC050389 TaxID=3155516 RepID=UPI0033E1729C